ncbi:MAG TPA: DUF5953 family protein, partial [Ramlibacter sp.]
GLVSLAVIALLVPRSRDTSAPAPLREELATIARPQVLLGLLMTMLGFAGVFVVITYVQPLLTTLTGFSDAAVSPILLVFGGGLVAGSPACLDVSVAFVPESGAQIERVLCEVGDALEACWARWTPRPLVDWQRVLQQGARDVQGLAALTPEGVRLQRLKLLATRLPVQPEAGGWWNYWSARTAAFLGLHDPNTDTEFRGLARTTDAGAWMVKLGPDAFEALAAPAMQRLAWVHERLPLLGVREA